MQQLPVSKKCQVTLCKNLYNFQTVKKTVPLKKLLVYSTKLAHLTLTGNKAKLQNIIFSYNRRHGLTKNKAVYFLKKSS